MLPLKQFYFLKILINNDHKKLSPLKYLAYYHMDMLKVNFAAARMLLFVLYVNIKDIYLFISQQ